MEEEKEMKPGERLFCSYCALLGNATDAAVSAGFPAIQAGAIAQNLLRRDDIGEEVERLRALQRRHIADNALAGLARVALGGVNDAVGLLLRDEPPTSRELAKLDLFAVSEIKQQKGGGLEMKFYDRTRALELLLIHGKQPEDAGGHSFYAALEKGAAAVAAAETGQAEAEGSDGDAV